MNKVVNDYNKYLDNFVGKNKEKGSKNEIEGHPELEIKTRLNSFEIAERVYKNIMKYLDSASIERVVNYIISTKKMIQILIIFVQINILELDKI